MLQTKTTRVEAVKGGLRTALSDPVNLFKTCDAAGLTIPVTLGGPGLNTAVDTKCWKMASTLAEDPNTLRYGLATTKAGSLTPTGSIGTVMPGSGGTPVNAWVAQTTTSPADDKMWLPQLPARHLNIRSPIGYSMPAGYPNCLVYFPGTYVDPVTIEGSTPVYFTSGIYYFEQAVRFSGDARVVIGGGAEEGCTNDQEAAFYAVNAPTVHNISGLGATFVFGGQGRLVVDTATAGAGANVVFNQRYTSAADVTSSSSAGVSIVSVNGEMSGATYIDYDRANSMFVPKSMVAGTTPVPATDQGYKPSTLVNGAPGVAGRYVRVQLASSTDALSLAEVLVNGVATNGVAGEIARSKTATQSSTGGDRRGIACRRRQHRRCVRERFGVLDDRGRRTEPVVAGRGGTELGRQRGRHPQPHRCLLRCSTHQLHRLRVGDRHDRPQLRRSPRRPRDRQGHADHPGGSGHDHPVLECDTLEHELRPAVRAEDAPRFGDIEEYARMPAPERGIRGRAMQRQVLLGDFDFARVRHGGYFFFAGLRAGALTGVSQDLCFLSLPCTRLKNAFCSFSVTGPRLPMPIWRPSTSRIGVTSAAVPVKNGFVGDVQVVARYAPRADRVAEIGGQLDYAVARDAHQRAGEFGFVDLAVLDHEDVLAGALGDEAVHVEQQALRRSRDRSPPGWRVSSWHRCRSTWRGTSTR